MPAAVTRKLPSENHSQFMALAAAASATAGFASGLFLRDVAGGWARQAFLKDEQGDGVYIVMRRRGAESLSHSAHRE
jgi:hypothetical protein